MPFKTIKNAKDDGFPTTAEGVDLTIEQINKLASIYDEIKEAGKVDNPMAVAWVSFKKIYNKAGDNWEKIKKASEPFLSFPVLFSDAKIKERMEINVMPVGKWDHPNYGKIEITEKDINEFIQNFDAGLRKGVPITEGHPSSDEELPAVGWFKKLINKGNDGLWAVVEWTQQGRELLKQKAYKYFSPEFYHNYEDPETRKSYKNVLTAGALTNMPYFKDLQAIVFSEPAIINQFNKIMNIEEIKKKKLEDLSDEEKSELKKNSESLSDEEKKKFEEVLNDEENKKIDEKKEEEERIEKEKKEEEEKEEKAAQASEKAIKMSAGEYKALTEKADRGAEAFGELRKMRVEDTVKSFEFSEKNKDGKYLPKSKEKIVSFMMSLEKGQMEKFQEILSELPKIKIFGEIGDLGVEKEESVADLVEKKVQAKIKDEDGLKYSDALRQVFAEDKQLEKRYNEIVEEK